LPAFGDLATSFSTDSSYQTIEQRNRLKEDNLLEIKKTEKMHQKPGFVKKATSENVDAPNKIKVRMTESSIKETKNEA
jgi:hypothetical protein